MNKKIFKAGDRIRCVNEKGAVIGVTKGNVYTVKSNDMAGLQLEGIECVSGHWEQRFVLDEGVNLNIPVFTAEGTPVEIITTAGRDKKYPVLAYEGKAKLPSKYTLEGKSKSREARRNLTNVQAVEEPTEAKEEAVEEVVLYANLYDTTFFASKLDIGNTLYASSKEANESYKEGRIKDKSHPKRIGVAKVTLVKGKLPSRFNKEGK